MLDVAVQVLLAAIRTSILTGIHIILYTLLSRILLRWLGLNSVIGFFCSHYCISKIFEFFHYVQLKIRLRRRKPDEIIVLDELTCVPEKEYDKSKFENDWKLLIKNDQETLLSSIVDVPFQNGWLFLIIILTIDYQINNSEDSYIQSISRTIGFLLLLISGAAVRYQTLFQREQDKILDLLAEDKKDFERFIIYLKNTIPIASFGLQTIETSENTTFVMHSFFLNSKFNIYVYSIVNYTCENMIDEMKRLVEEDKKSVRFIWPFPSCKKDWKYAIKANKLVLKRKYKDFSFMPFVHSYVEQYEHQESVETKKDQ